MPICLADLLIFFVVGIWHGAAWKYIAYGMYNGIIIAVSSLLEPLYAKGFEKTKIHKESKAWTVVQIIRTFILVNIGWYFDMAVSFSAALVMMKETFTKMSMSQFTGTAFLELGMGRRDFLIVLAGCIIILTNRCFWSCAKDLSCRRTGSSACSPRDLRCGFSLLLPCPTMPAFF